MTTARPAAVRGLAVLVVATLGLAACGSSKNTSSGSSATTAGSSASSGGSGSSGALKIGFFGALTGPNAQLGINIENGEKLAISQYNASNPTHRVSLDAFDSQGLPSQASNGAQKLIADKDVAVIGPAFSGESAAADPIFEQAGIPNISASATNPSLATAGRKYFHRVLAADNIQGPAVANYIVKTLGDKTVAVIDDNSTYGAGLASALAGQVTKDGGTVSLTDHLDPNGQDYGSTVNKVIASKASAIFFGGYYDAAGRLIHQLSAAGYKGAFISGDGSKDPKFIADAGGASFANGAYLSCPCADETNNPSAQAFVSAYKSMFSTDPGTYSAEGYDATNFVLAAIKSGATTPTAINSYLASNSYTGVTKTIKFESNGDVAGGTIYMYQVKNGQIVQIGTTS